MDVRILAATNKDISSMIKTGEFREDLYYRMAVIPLRIPPLRERREDIRLLVEHFVVHYHDGRRPAIRIGEEAMELFMEYGWPGNIRELKNLIERLSILKAGEVIEPDDLPMEFLAPSPSGEAIVDELDYRASKRKVLEEFHRKIVTTSLARHGGNVSRASESLGLARGNFQRIMKQYGMNSSDFRGEGQAGA